MTLQDAVELTEVIKLLRAEITAFAQGAVQARRSMALGQNKTITVGILVILGVNAFHDIKIKRDQRLRGRQGAAGMASARLIGHGDDVAANAPAHILQFQNIHQKYLLFHARQLTKQGTLVRNLLYDEGKPVVNAFWG